MSLRYSRWDAPSDRDYDDPCQAPPPVVVTCVQCARLFETDYDERPPYRCPSCCEWAAELLQHAEDRRAS